MSWQARVDSGKAQRELGFAPQSLEAGVAETVRFLRADGIV
jgi:nucleoside-diphosphate-sugar epimerase